MRFALVLLAAKLLLGEVISGTLIDSESTKAMAGVRLSLFASRPNSEPIYQFTNAQGKFSFEAPAGKYQLFAEYRGQRQQYGQTAPASNLGVSIYSGPGFKTADLAFRWYPLGAVTGIITDSKGESIRHANVQLLRRSVVLGRSRVTVFANSTTNDRGEYRFHQVPGGTYYVGVTAVPWQVAEVRMTSESSSETEIAYRPAYFPNALTFSDAAPINVTPGGEALASLSLDQVAGSKITINCAERMTLTVSTSNLGGPPLPHGASAFCVGAVVVAGVPAGQYVLRANQFNSATEITEHPISVGASAASVELKLGAAPSIAGRVTFADHVRPRSPLIARAMNQTSFVSFTATVKSDGTFIISPLPVGSYRFYAASADGFYGKEIAGDVDRGIVNVESGAAAKISARVAKGAGRAKGFVTRNEVGAPGMLAVLAPVHALEDAGRYRVFLSDSDGSFDFMNIEEGEYSLFAVEQPDFPYAEAEKEFVKALIDSGERIQIKNGSEVSRDIHLR